MIDLHPNCIVCDILYWVLCIKLTILVHEGWARKFAKFTTVFICTQEDILPFFALFHPDTNVLSNISVVKSYDD